MKAYDVSVCIHITYIYIYAHSMILHCLIAIRVFGPFCEKPKHHIVDCISTLFPSVHLQYIILPIFLHSISAYIITISLWWLVLYHHFWTDQNYILHPMDRKLWPFIQRENDERWWFSNWFGYLRQSDHFSREHREHPPCWVNYNDLTVLPHSNHRVL